MNRHMHITRSDSRLRRAYPMAYIAAASALLLIVALGAPAVADNAPPALRSMLVEIPAQPHELAYFFEHYDVWQVQGGAALHMLVSSKELAHLRLAGYEPTVLDADVYATWEAIASAAAGGAADDWTQYHNLPGVNNFLDGLHAAYPDLTAPFTIGTSIEGRPINGLRISDDAARVDPTEPAVFFVGCHHAREWISVEVPLYLAEQLLMNYGSDPFVTNLVNRTEIWIVPVLNVDGFLYTEQVNRLWRKNRRNNGNGSFGIDLNRNYSYEWGGPGSSGTPSSETYRGTAPFSEPETAAVRDLFLQRQFAGGFTYHSYGQLVMSPWGYTTAPPPGSAAMEALVAELAGIINSHNPPRPYTSGRWGVALYIGSGIFVDWVFGVHGIPGVITELRPVGSPGFILPASEILPTCQENYPAALRYIEYTTDTGWTGDLNCDGFVDNEDIDPFVLALTQGQAVYQAQWPDCDYFNADINGDGAVDNEDIDPFVMLIAGM